MIEIYTIATGERRLIFPCAREVKTVLEEDYGIWTVQRWLYYLEVSTMTMIYTHALNRAGRRPVAHLITGYRAVEIGCQSLEG